MQRQLQIDLKTYDWLVRDLSQKVSDIPKVHKNVEDPKIQNLMKMTDLIWTQNAKGLYVTEIKVMVVSSKFKSPGVI